MVEIAAVRFKGGRRLGKFHSMVNPQREISPGAYAVNKITPAMLAGAPGIEEVAPAFIDFIKGSCLCSYNSEFDMGFLYQELALAGKHAASYEQAVRQLHIVDVLKMARRLMPGLARYPLWFVAQKLGLPKVQEHRALADVELTLAVFMRLKDLYTEKGLAGFGHFVSLFGMNAEFLEEVSAGKLAQIQEALSLGASLRIQYLSTTTAAITQRDVQPLEIKSERNNLYLVGRCRLRNEDRSFKIDNILHLEIARPQEGS